MNRHIYLRFHHICIKDRYINNIFSSGGITMRLNKWLSMWLSNWVNIWSAFPVSIVSSSLTTCLTGLSTWICTYVSLSEGLTLFHSSWCQQYYIFWFWNINWNNHLNMYNIVYHILFIKFATWFRNLRFLCSSFPPPPFLLLLSWSHMC